MGALPPYPCLRDNVPQTPFLASRLSPLFFSFRKGRTFMSRLFITGGTLIDPERRERIDANLLVDDGVIRAFLPRGDEAP